LLGKRRYSSYYSKKNSTDEKKDNKPPPSSSYKNRSYKSNFSTKPKFEFNFNKKEKKEKENKKKYSIDPKMLQKIKEPLKKFDEMIGLEGFKSSITEMVMYQLQYRKKGDMLHTVIEGPPGVGKTEIGKILAEVYANMGIIKENKIVIARRTDLIAEYLGQTGPKTQKVIDKALGGVLFIDEAYSLGSDEKTDIYSKECIDTLNQNLSDNKKDFICIIAGYPDQLEQCFFAKNPGLKRRFPFTFRIDGYDYKELCGIFLKKLKDSKWKIDGELDTVKLEKFFKDHMDDFPHFGGDVENLVVSCEICQSQRIFGKHPKNKYKLTWDDIVKGLERFKNSKKKGLDNKKHELMYI
jgi:SpoVK/Ycf46/Vps4 family AAA+-type ATPase